MSESLSLSCRYKESNEHGMMVERCLRDATFMVDGKSYCHSHVVEAKYDKNLIEGNIPKPKRKGIRIANKTHHDGWTAKLQRVWRKDGSEADIIIIEDLMVPDEFTIHVRGKQYAHVEQPADMDSAIAVAELGMLAWGMGSTEATKEETVEALKGLLGVDPGKNDEEESDKVSEEEHDRMVEPVKFPECSKSDAVVDAAKNIVIKAAMECADEIGEDNRKLSTYGNLRDALNRLKKVWV